MSIHHMVARPVLLWDIILWRRHFYDNVEQAKCPEACCHSAAHLLGKYRLSCAVPIELQIGAGLGKVFRNFTRILSHPDVNAQPLPPRALAF
jgi:hypothetical protein